jgi:TRAP-type C4-dicarboxylate transport system substrate-binding protein
VPEDFRGLRIRHPSSVVGETLRAWGASPAGMPASELAGNLDKGVIDGLVIPYDGVLAFRLAPYVDYSTELLSYVTSFAVVMNPESYAALPPDLRRLIDETTGKEAARRTGVRWDSMEQPGREYMRAGGVEIIELSDAERAVFADAAAHLVEERLAQTEAMGLPAREFLARVRELAARY